MISTFLTRRLLAGSALPVMAAVAMATIATPIVAQTASPSAAAAADTSDTGQEIVVTGTIFRRTNTETPSPVSVITAASLERRGLNTVADAIQTISASNGGSVPQGFLNAFASGAQGVSLRGLTTNSTIVLFDGLRGAYYPLADDGQRSFVDLNTIPDAIVDRIETVKDGASSTYGADAIGGVVNVILKKEIKGFVGNVEGGISQRGDVGGQRVQLTWGTGDLASDGWNFYVSGEFQHSSSLMAKERGFPYNTKNLSSIKLGNGYTGANGNTNFLPPSTSNSSSNIVAVVRPANQQTAGDILSGVAIPGGQYQVLNPAGCASGGLITHSNTAGTYCEQDLVNNYTELLPELNHYGLTGHFTVNLNDTTQAYLVGTYYQSNGFQKRAPSSIRSNNPVYTYGLVLPARLANGQLNPQDPYAASGRAAMLFYMFGDIPQTLNNEASTYRVAGGIDGKFGTDDAWSYTVEGTYMRTDLTQTRHGFINVAALTSAINNGTYNFINPSANSQSIRDTISPEQQSKAHSQEAEIKAILSREVAQLPGGALSVGVGGEFRYEDINDPNPNPGKQFIGINTFQAVGDRKVSSAFFEINAPVLSSLEIDGSGRYDHYSTGFSHFSPKIGAKFRPIKQIALRGTFSKGFRAPSIPETSGNVIGFVNYTPPKSVQDAHGGDAYVGTYSLGLNSIGNPNLKPETSRSFTGGGVFEPTRWLSFTVDYYNIRKKNLIFNPADSTYANAYMNGQSTGNVTITPNAPDPNFPNLLPTPLFVNSPYINGQSLVTSGLDIQVQASLKFSNDVKFSSSLEVTDIFKYNINTGTDIYKYVGTLGSYNVTSASGTPKWRAVWENTLEFGRYALTATGYYTDGYHGWASDYNGIGSCGPNGTPANSYLYNGDISRSAGDALQCKVKHFISVDLTGNMRVSDDFSIYFNVFNLFDAKAPFDPNTYGGNNYNPAWSQAGIIGRYFKVGARFKF
jgi:iron complex outermembrane receptor protein